MEKLISQIRERLNTSQYQSESAIREAVILPILQALGWEVFDPVMVQRECPLGQRRVDYALVTPPSKKQIFIEAKAQGQSIGADKQLFEYAFHEGIPFAILTDGKEWNFYLPGEQGNYDERRVQKLDVCDRPLNDVIEVFRKYLSAERVHSGQALQSARADYQNIAKTKIAVATIPAAWNDLIDEPDSLLIDLIAEKTEAMCGYRPGPEDVEEFILSLSTKISDSARSEPTIRVQQNRNNALTPASERGIAYRMFGQERRAATATEALLDILRTLAGKNPSFLDALAPAVRGRSRNHLARRKEDVYPEKPDLVEYTVELLPGWWLGTNISNRDKMRIINKACEIERLSTKRDIVISLPNA